MEEIRYLSGEEKERTRALWERIFAEDSKEFLDYYYSVKTKENEILVLEEEGRICSMLQLNPYRLQLGEAEAEAPYIIAVATEEDCRHRGMMRKLLYRTMRDRREAHQPLLFLMPAKEEIYRPFGFRFVYRQQRDRFWADPMRTGSYSLMSVRKGEEASAAEFASRMLEGKKDVFACRDAGYYEVLRQESEAEDGALAWILDGERRIGLIAYGRGMAVEIREPLLEEAYVGRTEAILKTCFSGEKRPLDVYGLLYPGKEEKPVIMVRPLHLPTLLSGMRAKEELTLTLRIRDAIFSENNGIFYWQLGPEGSCLEKIEAGAEPEPDVDVSVEALTQLLFDWADVENIPKEELCIFTEEARKKWEKIETWSRVCLNEIV